MVLYRYDIHEEEAIELDTAPFYLTPAFKIGEMARMLNRKETTIRRYETAGLIPTPRRIHYSKKHPMKVRIYSVSDAFELAEFFSNRRSVGRPSSLNSVSRINYKEVLTHINARYESIG